MSKTIGIIGLILTFIAVGFAFLSWQSSLDSTNVAHQSLNLSEETSNQIKNLNEKVTETNGGLNEIKELLNLTNRGIANLEPSKPNIFFVQGGPQNLIKGSEITEYCKTIFNCSYNYFIAIDDNRTYTMTFFQIENNGSRATKLTINLYYSNKDFVIFGTDRLADQLSSEINPINKIIKLNVEQLGTTSNVRFFVLTNVSAIMPWTVQYDSNEISGGNFKINL